jgi:hypothetical protein
VAGLGSCFSFPVSVIERGTATCPTRVTLKHEGWPGLDKLAALWAREKHGIRRLLAARRKVSTWFDFGRGKIDCKGRVRLGVQRKTWERLRRVNTRELRSMRGSKSPPHRQFGPLSRSPSLRPLG